MVTTRGHADDIKVLLYSYSTTIAGWGFTSGTTACGSLGLRDVKPRLSILSSFIMASLNPKLFESLEEEGLVTGGLPYTASNDMGSFEKLGVHLKGFTGVV